ncbi:cytochrome c oxidase subunit 3 [Roseococcus sp. YIM B11640]|uniref:cytochrome c oxidase subunit 3 n=1 Tax=Roseococcus sp. YIM B11640 TaxID=3133973 RepID=UPI003C7B294B
MRQRVVLDLTELTPNATGTASLTWWGTLAFMLIEGTGFLMMIAVYLYLASIAPAWPPDTPPPDPAPGLWITGILLVSVVPNVLVSRWAQRRDLKRVRAGLVVMTLLGIAALLPRIYEFPAMHAMWDSNAYGSAVWVLLGLHTTHILTDLIDTVVLCALMFTRHAANPRRFGDVQDNALYWNFVVLIWLPIWAILYGVPRL